MKGKSDMRNRQAACRKLAFAAAFVAMAAPAMAVDTDDQLVDRVRRAVIRYHLSDMSDCKNYRIIRNVHPRVDEVDVFERHDAKCGGDPGTQPRLFSFIVDRQTGRMATTALDPDGVQYVRLK